MLPRDLVPLPTMPWDERPVSLPLDIEECRTALWLNKGNITKAAEQLKVPSARLRKFVRNSPYLTEEWNESREMLADVAEEVVEEALLDETDPGRRDTMARWFLAQQGKLRGYGNGNGSVSVNLPKSGRIAITWGDGTSFNENGGEDDPKTIEHEAGESVDRRRA